MNRASIAGYLANDPLTLSTSTGSPGARINIAAKDLRNNNETYFISCIAWQQQANFILTYLKKGDFVVIDGRITVRKYTSKEGKIVSSTDVVVDTIRSANSSKTNPRYFSEPNSFANSNNKTTTNLPSNEELQNLNDAFPETIDLNLEDAFDTKDVSDKATKKQESDDISEEDQVVWADDLDD